MNKVKYKINNDIIFSITKYLVEKYNIKEPVKLQKILYFLYLDYLKQYDEKLFDDEFEAWIYGPVIRKIFNHIRYNGYNFIEIESYTDKYLEIEKIQYLTDEKVKNFINENIKKYINMSSIELVEKTRDSLPWIKARKNLGPHDISKNKLLFKDIQEFTKGNNDNE
ncbi:Panacea domain-containing protein [Spiroplasma endosymbiont of Glossina fuscipes fuscipes]|uniref:Panacea domain-containing protein n=1 Tax=Spiroplasma endosymbiont of Glossina fuscipes fuscipes TaxID=2004463 RepID=UPI003C72F6DE